MNNQNTRNTQITQSSQNNQGLHFLPQYGHYRHLRVYQVAEALYDLTYYFCKHFLSAHGDRTVDQMIQAARSGKQNIAEGNQTATTSSETEIKASLEELLADFEDYLRTRSLQQWDSRHPRFASMRQWTKSDDFISNHATKASYMSDEELANLCITLCHQSIYMLTRLIRIRQERFITQGGDKGMYALCTHRLSQSAR